MRWHWGITALSHSPTSWMASVLSQWGLFSWLLITMCHCTEQNSYMGHPSPSSLWIRDGTGRDALLNSRKSCFVWGVLSRLDACLAGISDWILEHLDSRWSQRTSGIAIFFWLQTICHPGRTHFAAGDAETLAKIRRRVKQEASDNEALYCRPPSAPSYSFSLQWLIHRELHCVMASRCEEEYNTLWQVAVIFTASIVLYCMDTAGLHQDRLCRDSILCSDPPLPSPSSFNSTCRLGLGCVSLHTPRVNSAQPGPTSGPAERITCLPGEDRLNATSLGKHNDVSSSEPR